MMDAETSRKVMVILARLRKAAGKRGGRGNKKPEDNVSSGFRDDGKTGRTRAAVAEELKVLALDAFRREAVAGG